MYKAMFQNSKIALLFAGMTIFSAVSMVGTSEEGGVLTAAVDLVESQREDFASDAQAFGEARSIGDAPAAPAAGWGGNGAVFGEYAASEPGSAPAQGAATPAGSATSGDPATAPVAAGAVIKKADGSFTDAKGRPIPTPPPVIIDRELTIEPQ